MDPLLDGHVEAFAHFGGCPRTILYDNPRTIVLGKDEAAGLVEWNATFKDRMDFYGVAIRLCRYYRARTPSRDVVLADEPLVRHRRFTVDAQMDLLGEEVHARLAAGSRRPSGRRAAGTRRRGRYVARRTQAAA